MSFESWRKKVEKRLKADKEKCICGDKTFEEFTRNRYEKERTQEDEFEDARKENRQPKCVYCGNLLDRVSEVQGIQLVWEWDKSNRGMSRQKPMTVGATSRCVTTARL